MSTVDAFFYPHTVTVYSRTQPVVGATKRAANLTRGEGVSVDCDVQRKTTSEAFQLFGLELTSPAVLYCALADRDKFAVPYIVAKGSDLFAVAGEPRVLDAGDVLDGCAVPLEGLQVTS